ncbi:MAG: SDR family NAD(P)-dependent oxidoreductase, partial [Desulfobacteraceae bacterium]|nr:SDR family NAD(P)-dependent oxidoreductase [Desulfobacteraceae bacterium]
GIGKALARELAKRGCTVILVDIQTSLVNEVAKKINKSGGRAEAKTVDVTCFKAMKQLINKTVDQFDRLDYMFNNAGIGLSKSMRPEARQNGVGITLLCPGYVQTPFLDKSYGKTP